MKQKVAEVKATIKAEKAQKRAEQKKLKAEKKAAQKKSKQFLLRKREDLNNPLYFFFLIKRTG